MTAPVRIPADVDMHDRVLGPLTARQLAVLAATGAVLYLIWAATRAFVPIPVFLAFAVPVSAASAMLALGRRDGVPMDKLLVAATRWRVAPRHRVAAPEGVRPAPAWLSPDTDRTTGRTEGRGKGGKGRAGQPEQVSPSALRLPAEAVTETGVVDLGADGLAVVAVASTVNFALRTPNEQEALVASFGRYLHSLTAPVQVLVRTERLDLSAQIAELRERAGGLPHPALEAAAVEHADYLVQLGQQSDLLRRQVLLVLREPLGVATPTDGLGGPGPLAVLSTLLGSRRASAASRRADRSTPVPRRAAESRLVRRLGEAIELLSPAGIVVTPLDAGQATAVLASACNPDSLLPPSAGLAGADEVITTSAADLTEDDFDDSSFFAHTTPSPAPSGRSEDGDFNASPEDSRELSRHTAPRLSDHDLAHLGVYHAAVRLVLNGEEAQPFTILTQPLPPAIPGRAREIRSVARRTARIRASEAATGGPGTRPSRGSSGPSRPVNRNEPVARLRSADPRRNG